MPPRTRAELHTYLRAVPEPDAVRDLRRAGCEDLAWRTRGRQTTITFGTVKPERLPRSTIDRAGAE